MTDDAKAPLQALQQRQLYLRPTDEERIDKLVAVVARDPQIGALVRTWSDAARLVVAEGLAVLEERYGVPSRQGETRERELVPADTEGLEG